MNFTIQRETLLRPLQLVIGAVERRQTKPILSNVLVEGMETRLDITATDLEIELVAHVDLELPEQGKTTIPARKLFDICRTLPERAQMVFHTEPDKTIISSGRSRFTLSSLPTEEFPELGELETDQAITLSEDELKFLIDNTAFAMANQDVRYYLNGLLLEIGEGRIRTVATDGHRLAFCEIQKDMQFQEIKQVIIPRKGVLELQRLLESDESETQVNISSNHVQVKLNELRFTSKLIDGRFPDYDRVIPLDCEKTLIMDRESFRQALTRASILSNEKYRGVRLTVKDRSLRIQAHNPEQEEAEDELDAEYDGDDLEVGFNVSYLLDVLSVIDSEKIEIKLKDSNSSALVKATKTDQLLFVIMPMRL